ncbi:hypothetical protein CsSME_00024192 [Camellia sinensis var. sinensis]
MRPDLDRGNENREEAAVRRVTGAGAGVTVDVFTGTVLLARVMTWLPVVWWSLVLKDFSVQARVSIKSTAAVYFSLLGFLVGFIRINQGAAESPFKTHPMSMLASLMSACIYSLALLLKEFVELEGQQIIGENHARIFFYVTLIVAGLAPASLVSVLVPDWLIWLPYGIWFIFSVIVVRLKAWDLFTGFLPAQIAGPDNEN